MASQLKGLLGSGWMTVSVDFCMFSSFLAGFLWCPPTTQKPRFVDSLRKSAASRKWMCALVSCKRPASHSRYPILSHVHWCPVWLCSKRNAIVLFMTNWELVLKQSIWTNLYVGDSKSPLGVNEYTGFLWTLACSGPPTYSRLYFCFVSVNPITLYKSTFCHTLLFFTPLWH